MNNTFNLQRFSWFFKKTILERPMQLLGLAGLSLVIVFFSYVFLRYMAGFDEAQNGSFILGLVGGGCFLASTVYAYFSNNAMGSSFLTLPASQFEKWLCGILLVGVIYVVVFLLFFRVLDTVFVELFYRSLDPNAPFYKERMEQVQVFSYTEFVAKKGFLMFINFAGAMLIGSFYFNKTSFIKVSFLICGFWLGAFLINLFIAKTMMDNVDNAMPYYGLWINKGLDTGRIELPENIQKVIDFVSWVIVPTILWLLAYQKLREKEF
jgi:hypothetical protein